MKEGQVNGNGKAEHSEAIVAAPTLAIDPYAGETADQLLARAQQQITLHQGIVKLIAANIPPKEVMLFGDNIWLTKAACLRVLGWIGADVLPDNEIGQQRYDSTDGPYIIFENWGLITLKNGRKVRAVGNASTLDEFFAKENLYVCPTCGTETEFRNGNVYCSKCDKPVTSVKREYYKPLSEVDIPSIRLKAVTNFYNHALQTLGVMPTKDELIGAGMKLGEGGQVSFKKNSNKPQAVTSQKPPKAAEAKPNTPQAASAAPPSQPKPATAQDVQKKFGGTLTEGNSTKPPKANIPGAKPAQLPVGQGIVSEVYLNKTRPNANGKGGGKPFVKLVQNGHFLFCFKNSEIETIDGTMQTFDLLTQDSKGSNCHFIVESKDKDGETKHSIVGALRIGPYEWDEQGQPVSRRQGDAYEAQDEDIPF